MTITILRFLDIHFFTFSLPYFYLSLLSSYWFIVQLMVLCTRISFPFSLSFYQPYLPFFPLTLSSLFLSFFFLVSCSFYFTSPTPCLDLFSLYSLSFLTPRFSSALILPQSLILSVLILNGTYMVIIVVGVEERNRLPVEIFLPHLLTDRWIQTSQRQLQRHLGPVVVCTLGVYTVRCVDVPKEVSIAFSQRFSQLVLPTFSFLK